MSYLAFDLDAIGRVPDAARSAGIPEAELGYGLVRLWKWCWVEKTDRVEPSHLRGFFGGDTVRVAQSLAAFKFIELDVEHWFRVRGAERYLRVQKARSEGGKTASGNLKRGMKPGSATVGEVEDTSRDAAPAVAGEQPENTPGTLPGLTSSIEHRASSSLNNCADGAAPVETPTPKVIRESDELCADFEAIVGSKYMWQGAKDTDALKALRNHASLEEVRARWRRGIAATGWPHTATVAQLRAKWNDLAGDAAGPNRSKDNYRQLVRPEDELGEIRVEKL